MAVGRSEVFRSHIVFSSLNPLRFCRTSSGSKKGEVTVHHLWIPNGDPKDSEPSYRKAIIVQALHRDSLFGWGNSSKFILPGDVSQPPTGARPF